MRAWVVSAGVWLCSSGCVEAVKVDIDETGTLTAPATAEFDPGNRILPLPNVLLLDRATGRLNLPAPCEETVGSSAYGLRLALNQLDGFSTSAANIVATFNTALDEASLEGRVFLLRLAERGAPVDFEGLVEIDVALGRTQRVDANCASSSEVNTLLIRPRQPLAGASTYAVLLLSGIRSASGEVVEPSATWGLVRQKVAPVRFGSGASAEVVAHNATPFDARTAEGLARLHGLDLLWRAHAPLLQAFDSLAPALAPGSSLGRGDVLLAWAFPTQTLAEPFDATVEGSPAQAGAAVSDALSLPPPLAGEGAPLSVEAFYGSALPGVPCSALGCAAIGSIYAGGLAPAPSFVSPSFLAGDDCDPATEAAIGAFDDPQRPSKACDQNIELLAVVPLTPPGESGYPTLVFGHGLARSKEDLLVLAGTFAQAGIASVAFDAVDHGSRALRTSSAAALGCDGAGPGKPCTTSFGPTCAPQCFAPLLSANLPVTRDHLRQTVLDQLQLERVLRACAGAGVCRNLQVDPARIGYVGHALGALLGGVSVAMGGVYAAALNEPAGDWLKVLSDTATDSLRCTLVDALIASGVLEGVAWQGGQAPGALCLGDSWKSEPRFLEFAAAARWLLDPVDPVNYAARYSRDGAATLLLQEIAEDPVIPNSATLAFASLLQLEPEAAGIAASAMPAPSRGAQLPGSHWLRYSGLNADPALMFPGNAYGPGSLLSPAAPSATMAAQSGQLGTLLMRIDLLSFLGSRP